MGDARSRKPQLACLLRIACSQEGGSDTSLMRWEPFRSLQVTLPKSKHPKAQEIKVAVG